MEKKKFKFGLGGWIFAAMVLGVFVGLACVIKNISVLALGKFMEGVFLESVLYSLAEGLHYECEDEDEMVENITKIKDGSNGAVQAILADVYLWMEDYDNCIAYCEKVIASKIEEAEEENFRYDGKYPLIGNRKENSAAEVHEAYNQIFGEGNSFESIFEIQFRENQQYNSIIPGYFGNVNSHIGAISAASFICDGATMGGELFTRNDLRATENFNAKSTSFYPIRKYVVSRIDNQDNVTYRSLDLSNWIFYRLSDVMLMEAEALTERSQGEETDMRKAFGLVSSVYNRANIGQANKDTLTFDSYNSFAKMESLVLQERQRELMFEGKRWFDLVRKARREGSNSAMLDLAKRKYTYPDAVKSKWIKPDMLYFPINEDELKVNLLLKQNPGYDMGETIKRN